jgi:GABA(A) receptor-associated protein
MFKSQISLQQRQQESKRILDKYPDKIPIICEKRTSDHQIPQLIKFKYLVPSDFTVGQFVFTIRKKIELPPEQALYIFLENNILPPTVQPLGLLYEQNKNEDGFLYIIYAGENTFGKK